MARVLFVLLVVMFVLGAVMLVRNAADLYKGLPVDVDKPLVAEPFEDWRAFTSAIGRFRVMLPSPPIHAEENLPVPDSNVVLEYHMYASETNDGATYMISLILYPAEIDTSKPDNMLENVMNEMASANPENKLRWLNFHDYLGYKALDFFIEGPEIVVASRAFVVEKVLYLLTTIDKKANYSQEDFDYFLESFELLAEQVLGPAA